MEPIAITISEAAKALSVCRTTLYGLLNGGELQTIKIGSRRAVTVESIRRFADDRTQVKMPAQAAHLDIVHRKQAGE